MKIGIDASILEYERTYRGISKYTACMLKALLRQDKRNEYLIYINREDPVPVNNGAENVRYVQTTRRRPLPPVINSYKGIRHQLLIPFRFYSDGVDIVYSFAHRYAPLFSSGKQVVTVLDVIPELYPEIYLKYARQRIMSQRWKRTACNADEIITISEASKTDIVRLYGIDPGKVHVVYPGYERDLFKALPHDESKTEVQRKYQINSDYILYAGGFDRRKNLRMLIEVFSILKVRYGIQESLVIVGDTRDAKWLRPGIQERGIENDVVLTGYVPPEDLAAFYSGAGLFVFPSLYEGFGLPVLEAMACGAPVIASDTSSIPEVAGGAAVLLKTDDPDTWAERIFSLLKDEALRQQMRTKGIQQASRFSWEESADKVLQLFNTL